MGYELVDPAEKPAKANHQRITKWLEETAPMEVIRIHQKWEEQNRCPLCGENEVSESKEAIKCPN